MSINPKTYTTKPKKLTFPNVSSTVSLPSTAYQQTPNNHGGKQSSPP